MDDRPFIFISTGHFAKHYQIGTIAQNDKNEKYHDIRSYTSKILVGEVLRFSDIMESSANGMDVKIKTSI